MRQQSETYRQTVREAIDFACGEVGIFGVIAELHDRFNRNPAMYETYPVIQRELRRFDAELRLAIEPVEDRLDKEVSDEISAERFAKHSIVPLCDR